MIFRMVRMWAIFSFAALSAWAQPVTFKLQNDVPGGKRPSLAISAIDRVTELELSLVRNDGLKVLERAVALNPGATIVLSIGDGAAGRAHYQGSLKLVSAAAGPWAYDLTFDTLVRGEIKVTYRRDHLDLDGKVLEFQLSRPAGRAELKVIGDDGQSLGHGAAVFSGEPAGTWLRLPWQADHSGTVMTLELHAVGRDGLATNVRLVPWSVEIPHEEVNFPSGIAAIESSERPKLDAALARIAVAVAKAEPFVRCHLFIAGHTDTVGTRESNQHLSIARARAIALYFRQQGIKIPISYEGFGEDRLKVKTADETDERQNRRADYLLSADEPLVPGSVVKWKAVQ